MPNDASLHIMMSPVSVKEYLLQKIENTVWYHPKEYNIMIVLIDFGVKPAYQAFRFVWTLTDVSVLL